MENNLDNSYHYQEFLTMIPKEGLYDTDRLIEIVKTHAPLSFSGQSSDNVWVICYSKESKTYAVEFDLDNGPRPGLPIVIINNENLEVGASYDDFDNEKFRELLDKINETFPSCIYDEYGRLLKPDFSKYPTMKDNS